MPSRRFGLSEVLQPPVGSVSARHRHSRIACSRRARGIASVAVTAGYVCPEPRAELFAHVDAANIDLKSFDDGFYRGVCGGRLGPVLETIEYVARETEVWLELTTLLIPGLNDSDVELEALTSWVVERLGPDVPLHFTAFHPDWKLRDPPPTPPATLTRARRIALANGVRYAYTGNVHDPEGQSTWCRRCGALLIERDWYRLGTWNLTVDGRCRSCGECCAGVFDAEAGDWGERPLPIRIGTV